MSRARKLVHLAAKRTYKNVEPFDEAVTEALGFHLPEDGRIVSKKLVVFQDEFKTQEQREMTAKDLAEQQRVARNRVIPLSRKDVV